MTRSEETDLVEYLHSTSRIGYGKTRHQVLNLVERVAKEKGALRKGKITSGWFRRFRERNPTLRLRKGDSMASVRFQCTSSEVVDEYYDLLETVLTEFDLLHKPGQIYNVDETGMSLDPRNSRFCLLYTSPSPRDGLLSRMPSSA